MRGGSQPPATELFAAQDASHFVQNLIRNRETDGTRFSQVKYLPRYPGEVEPGNEDVCIDGDAEHANGCGRTGRR